MVMKTPPRKSARKTIKIPMTELRYSWIYDEMNKQRFTDPLYPSPGKIMEYIERVAPMWKRREKTLLRAISRITEGSWH